MIIPEFSDKFLIHNPKVKEIMADSRTLKAYENKLTETDYKVIKCYEYSLIGLELPYDMEEVHAEREAIREKIRELEEKLT
jgi:hypothetical protein